MNIVAKYRLKKYQKRLKEAEKALQELNVKRDKQTHSKQVVIEKEPIIGTKEVELKLGKKRIVKEFSIVNKNANLVLLLVIVIHLVVVTASGIFFNQKFTSLKKDYDVNIDRINVLIKDISLNKQSLSSLQQNLQLKKEREQGISQQFLDVKKQKEQLDNEINKLTAANNKLLSDLEKKNDEIARLKEELADLKKKTGQ
jgi:chromosome segregation ATPase